MENRDEIAALWELELRREKQEGDEVIHADLNLARAKNAQYGPALRDHWYYQDEYYRTVMYPTERRA